MDENESNPLSISSQSGIPPLPYKYFHKISHLVNYLYFFKKRLGSARPTGGKLEKKLFYMNLH